MNSKKSSDQKLLTISEVYYQYSDIPLKLYLEIVEGKEIFRVQKAGARNDGKCAEVWESIVRENANHNGNFEFDIYFTNVQTFGQLVNEYIFVKAALTKLQFVIDKELIYILKTKGYNVVIDLSGTKEENSAKYAESLISCFKKSEHIVTQTTSKSKEIEELNRTHKQVAKSSFDSLMANLSFHWPGSNFNDDITLARYNEMLRLIKEKAKHNGRHRPE